MQPIGMRTENDVYHHRDVVDLDLVSLFLFAQLESKNTATCIALCTYDVWLGHALVNRHTHTHTLVQELCSVAVSC